MRVLDVATTDVPAIALARPFTVAGLVDATEEVTGAGRPQILQGFLDGDLDVLLGEVVGGVLRIDLLEHRDHRVTTGAGVGEVGALLDELGEEGHVGHDRVAPVAAKGRRA